MVWQRIRIAVLVCTVLALSTSAALAQDEEKGDKKAQAEKLQPPTEKVPIQPGGPAMGGPGGPIVSGPGGGGCGGGCGAPCGTRTVYVTECVPETYTATRTVYRTECRTENFTYMKCVPVQECRERTVCCTRRVPVMKTVCKKVCVTVPVCETRTVMKPCYSYQNVTTMKCRTVDRGHYECREVFSCCKAIGQFCGGLFSGGHHNRGGDCCNPCPPCPPPPPTRTVKVWVPCMVTEQCPVTCCKKICTMVPSTCTVTVNRTEWREQTCQVCTYQCVTENRVEKYTVCVMKQVPCQGCRTVRVCVPCQETYTACRMVSRTVCRQVADTCCSPCNDCCNPCCTTTGRKHKFGGLFGGTGGLFGGGHGRGQSYQSYQSGGCCN